MLRNGVHSGPCAKPPHGLISQRENAVRRLRRSHYIMQCSRSAMPCALFKQARRACFRELSGIKIIVITFEFQKFAMRTGFGDSSVADNKNSVRGSDCGKPVRNNEACSVFRTVRIALCISTSVSVSMELVASSRTKIRGSARITLANEISCF